jgi:hypothetical protein
MSKKDEAFLYSKPSPKKLMNFYNYAKTRHGLESDEIVKLDNSEVAKLQKDYNKYRKHELNLKRI